MFFYPGEDTVWYITGKEERKAVEEAYNLQRPFFSAGLLTFVLWALRGVSRIYFGGSSDIPVTR